MESDWRLFREQEKYLKGATLVKRSYSSNNPLNDHDHCEFCMVKFGKSTDALNHGYSTEDGNIWICQQCYDDFKKKFGWTIINKNNQ